jgi:hypothetical protein
MPRSPAARKGAGATPPRVGMAIGPKVGQNILRDEESSGRTTRAAPQDARPGFAHGLDVVATQLVLEVREDSARA